MDRKDVIRRIQSRASQNLNKHFGVKRKSDLDLTDTKVQSVREEKILEAIQYFKEKYPAFNIELNDLIGEAKEESKPQIKLASNSQSNKIDIIPTKIAMEAHYPETETTPETKPPKTKTPPETTNPKTTQQPEPHAVALETLYTPPHGHFITTPTPPPMQQHTVAKNKTNEIERSRTFNIGYGVFGIVLATTIYFITDNLVQQVLPVLGDNQAGKLLAWTGELSIPIFAMLIFMRHTYVKAIGFVGVIVCGTYLSKAVTHTSEKDAVKEKITLDNKTASSDEYQIQANKVDNLWTIVESKDKTKQKLTPRDGAGNIRKAEKAYDEAKAHWQKEVDILKGMNPHTSNTQDLIDQQVELTNTKLDMNKYSRWILMVINLILGKIFLWFYALPFVIFVYQEYKKTPMYQLTHQQLSQSDIK